MPNPKTNTVTNNPEKVILDIKKGMLGYKMILMEMFIL
jgi:ribosomal protein L1